jgi:hypothetical protein
MPLVISRETIVDLLTAVLEEAPEQIVLEMNPESASERITGLQNSFAQAVTTYLGILPRYTPTSLMCQLPHNPDIIVNSRKARQCVQCGKWFCQKHQLTACPFDGGQLR